jgi:hypothetical protein
MSSWPSALAAVWRFLAKMATLIVTAAAPGNADTVACRATPGRNGAARNPDAPDKPRLSALPDERESITRRADRWVFPRSQRVSRLPVLDTNPQRSHRNRMLIQACRGVHNALSCRIGRVWPGAIQRRSATRSLGVWTGTSLVSELQTSHTAPGPQVGHHATVGNSECQG